MAISYSVSKALSTLGAQYRATNLGGGNFEYRQRRGFMSFDLTASGITVGSVDTVELIVVCASTVGGGNTFNFRSATGASGFGATLDASNADWASTATNLEAAVSITSTGTYTISIDKNNLDYNGVNYFRISNTAEGTGANHNTGATFSSSESANDPILRITLLSGQIIYVNML